MTGVNNGGYPICRLVLGTFGILWLEIAILTLGIRTGQFLARDSIYAIARSLLSPVRLSVRLSVPLSVTRLDQSKTFEVRITQPSPQSSPMTLVS